MTLSPFDLAELDRLASTYADRGKTQAWRAYHAHAIAHGWGNTPAWVEGRTTFTAMWRRHRASYTAAMARVRAVYEVAA
jgi:hypothetical protein